MTQEELHGLLKTSGLPVVHHAWPADAAPPLPRLAYLDDGARSFSADGAVYYKVDLWSVLLYTRLKDPDMEQRVETLLDGAGIFWKKQGSAFIDSEEVYLTAYEIEV